MRPHVPVSKGTFHFHPTLHSTKELHFLIPLPHTGRGQSLVVVFHSMSHTVQSSPGHQDPRQTEISLSKGIPANSARASKGKGEA